MKRVIVIGTGGIGRRHIRGLLRTGRAELTLVEPHEERRQAAVRDHAPRAAFASLDEAGLAEHDLAFICAPAHVHLDLITACARARVPFLVEKPLAVTMRGVDTALDEVRRAGIEARVGFIRRIAPEVIALREKIAAGAIGEVKLAYLNSSQDFPKYRPDYRETYYARPETGGGAILDAASHFIDLLNWLLGRPATVSAMYDRLVLPGTDTEDTCLINIRYASGAMANITLNQFQKPNVTSCEFIGTTGNLRLDHSVLARADDDSGEWKERHDFMAGLVPTEAHEARFGLQAGAMLDLIAGRPCPLATLEDGRLALQVALAARQSWDERRMIAVLP